jgi:MoxR-like ATPase
VLPPPDGGSGNLHQATTYLPSERAVEQVNAALYLRRPLLVTGPPGTGKSTLAYAVAHELGLGPVLHWPITSRVTLRDGLYQYDPLTRLYAANRANDEPDAEQDIGRYIRLGPLGTAMLPYMQPRVLLIDEIDKSDIDLPNDLLTIFEKGEFEIAELTRLAEPAVDVMTADGASRATVLKGIVRCRAFPFIVMTSNGEREFPPAFLRRCVTVELQQPDEEEKLGQIVAAHLGEDLATRSLDLVRRFLDRKDAGTLANDQLLNAVYLCNQALAAGSRDRLEFADRLMPYLSGETGRDDD